MKKASPAAETYKAEPREREILKAFLTRRRAQKPVPKMTVANKKGAAKLQIDHPDMALGQVLLLEALGTSKSDFMDGLLRQLANAGSKGAEVDQGELNFMLAMVTGIEPRDQVEAMLAAQMATVHNAMMTFARRLNHVENIPQQDSAERAFNKLGRTFAVQVEALKRYRTGGQQRVTVEHVTVNAGGQAIVGNVETPGAGAPAKSKDQPHAITHAPRGTMPGPIEAEREAVPIAGSQRA
jgi:hypothetical protein